MSYEMMLALVYLSARYELRTMPTWCIDVLVSTLS